MHILILRFFFYTIGRLSHGIQLCITDGPTAGTTLDYVYRNEPHGRLIIGKWIDRRFLRYVGWERARQRHSAVQSVIQEAMGELTREGHPVHILDLACGTADYLRQIFASSSPPESTAVCRDANEKSIVAGNAWLSASRIPRISFHVGDALDRESILGLRPRPTLILSIGLYELLDDQAVTKSIRIVGETLERGGRFIVVHQVAHHAPRLVSQLFLRRGRTPPQLYLRSIQQLESSLRDAGLRPLGSSVCCEGWYVVIIARKDSDGSGPL